MTIARLTDYALSVDSTNMTEYIARDKFDKCLYYNKITHTIYDNNYIQLNSIKNTDKNDRQ